MNRIATDLKGITNWIFDLDDTLYPSSEEIFNQMAKRIKSFIMQALNVGEEEAFEIQKEYYKQYGATVRGLMLEHNIAPESFTDYVHELDLSCLKENPALKTCLDELPGKNTSLPTVLINMPNASPNVWEFAIALTAFSA